MNFGAIPLVSAMQQKMKYHSARQSELALNVANADTPNYRARDIATPNFGAMLAESSVGLMTTTNTMHMQPALGGKNGTMAASDRENTYELNPIGNNVVIEEEMMRVAENQSEYQKVLSIYRKTLEMFRIALGRPSGA